MYNKVVLFLLICEFGFGQVADPNLKLALKFENSIEGITPVTPTIDNGSEVYVNGNIGQGYEVTTVGNYIDLGCNSSNLNILDVTDEFTIIFKMKAAGIGPLYNNEGSGAHSVMQFHGNFSNNTGNNYGGLVVIFRDNDGLEFKVESSASGYGVNTTRKSRWVTGIEFIANEWVTYVCQRNASGARAYRIDASGNWTEATISRNWNPANIRFAGNTFPNIIGGAEYTGCGTVSRWMYGELDEVMIWNTYLSKSEIKRVVAGLHPTTN